MKQIRLILGSSAIVIGMFTLVLFSACDKKDSSNATAGLQPCKNVICLNGGACDDGQCNCAVGYEGTNCATRWSDKFIGNYQASDECFTGGTSLYYNASISSVVDYANKISIYNLGVACPGKNITAFINPEKTSFEIPMQNVCGTQYVYGTGNLSLQDINIYLVTRDTITHTANACSILLHRL